MKSQESGNEPAESVNAEQNLGVPGSELKDSSESAFCPECAKGDPAEFVYCPPSHKSDAERMRQMCLAKVREMASDIEHGDALLSSKAVIAALESLTPISESLTPDVQGKLVAALRAAYDYYMGPHACGDFTCACEDCGICDIRKSTREALALLDGQNQDQAEESHGN